MVIYYRDPVILRILKRSSFRIGKYIIPGDHNRSPKDSKNSYGLESVQKSPTQQIPGDLPAKEVEKLRKIYITKLTSG